MRVVVWGRPKMSKLQAPCFSTRWEEVSRSPQFPTRGAGPIAAGWKVEEEQTIEGVPALKHGAIESFPHCFVKVT